MSVLNKKWHIKNTDASASLLEKLLANRNLRDHRSIKTFLEPSIKDLYNPFLMSDMRKAVNRIKQAIKDEERIIIYGDYDVDGITGTTIAVRVLRHLKAKVSYRLPHRTEDGYGLNEKFIHEFKKLGVKLLITVDCGISCAKEISLAKSFGIDTIIADHHTVPENTPKDSYAILHPKCEGSLYPFKDLTGAGVALKLAYALLSDEKDETKIDKFAEDFLDLASLGTIADLGLLTDENRIIVKYGMEKMKHSKWDGLKYLKHYSGIKQEDVIDTQMVGFRLAPRINAAGRVAHPYYALRLLLEDGEDKGQTDALAQKLEGFNSNRQSITEKALRQAEEIFLKDNKKKILIAHSTEWHSGIIGLIAGKLTDKHHLPSIVMNETAGVLVASCRSPGFFNIVAAISEFGHLLEHFGGHAAAAGFTIKKENLKKFTKAMEDYADKKIKKADYENILEIDAEINADEITSETLKTINKFEPFGIGNPTPVLLIKNIKTQNVSVIGKNKDHLKFRSLLSGKSTSALKQIDTIGFRFGPFAKDILKSESLDIVFNLQNNTFNGRTQLQMNVVDLKIN
ncbi:MAG: exonuclease RecJ, single-stranded-DNA-specific exonuclease [Candidatus Peregrinibacteria bacterium GW2011_GWF2_38_29]|nr:MAG: exonuclease RecJ, single-stranded-DNA-specific exonuclease [Candidatus Peregrinibacteria bacterium GW2011_GWF2_38_29]HBB02335.1 single-stranded-DNA-specific exonuclease RecJ [Candidatus Peregrinibacteria bacterium]